MAPEPAAPARQRGRDYDRALFDAVPVPIGVADPTSGEVLDANRAFLNLVRLPAEQVVGVCRPYPWHAGDGRYRAADGREFPVEVATHVLGDQELLLCVVTDLSERRRLEQQLVQNGKLAAIGELAAGVAHEINNPLLAILGLTEFLLQDAEPGTKSHERLQLIQQTGLEIKEIVRALLDFARENPEERHVVDLQEVVHTTVELMRRTNAHKGVELVERYEAPGVRVSASPNQLKQLLLNLIANARQAMPDGGVIRVCVHHEDGHVAVVVADDGPGVPAELVGRIFEPFFTTRRGTGGTGLGLPVSLGIAESHGGTLSLSVEPGEGAEFTLRLPIVEGDT